MTWGRIEREIRLLPQVLSCAVSDDEIVVLVEPSADPSAVEAAVAQLLETGPIVQPAAALPATRVLGGAEPVRQAATRRAWRSPLVLAASVAATGMLAVSSLVGGLGTADRPSERQVPSVTGTALDGSSFPRPPRQAVPVQPSQELDAEPAARPAIRVLRPVLVGDVDPALPVPALQPKERAPVPAPSPVEPPSTASCHEPEARGAPKEVRGRHRGQGPMPWSHSVLNDPHCARGRPR